MECCREVGGVVFEECDGGCSGGLFVDDWGLVVAEMIEEGDEVCLASGCEVCGDDGVGEDCLIDGGV